MKLFDFQKNVLNLTKDKNKVAYYLDMGLGKTFVGSEKAVSFNQNIIVICQKSKIDDWCDHFLKNYDYEVFNVTKKNSLNAFLQCKRGVFVINYELSFRRPELADVKNYTLVLDESSMIQNDQAKRSKFILKKLKPTNIILLSGTPTGGKYEKLYSQLRLLGWEISKDLYWRQYVDFYIIKNQGFPIKIIKGYKNVERLKSKMAEFGCVFLKTNEVYNLPEQIFNVVNIKPIPEYQTFKKKGIVNINGLDLAGETCFVKMLYERMICGAYNKNKINALRDILNSSDDRFIIFYNFNVELKAIEDLCIELDRPTSIINGQEKDLVCYDEFNNSITLIQYQSGAMGLNLQKANRIIYFTPCLSSELFEQSKKRIHRIGQNKPCFYYELTCENTIEKDIYNTLDLRRDYTDELFKKQRGLI